MLNIVKTAEFLTQSNFTDLNHLGNNIFELNTLEGVLIIEVLTIDLDNKSMSIRHKHHTYDLVFKNELDLILDKMGIKRSTENLNKDVKAPMPGKVIQLIAKEGDKLSKGDGLLILEAMKMENVIKAEADCTIRKILISKLDNVEKNQILIELDFPS